MVWKKRVLYLLMFIMSTGVTALVTWSGWRTTTRTLDFGIVKVPVADLGDGPNSVGGSHTVTQARMGDYVRILGQEEGWCLVRMEDDYQGWIAFQDICAINEQGILKLKSRKQYLITAKMAQILDKPGGEPIFASELVQGTVLPSLGSRIGWGKVDLPGRGGAWVLSRDVKEFSSYATVFAEKKDAGSVIATASQYLGLPYLWGGCTAYGFDCSGLTQFCYKMNGYTIPRDADLQYEHGKPVRNRESLEPGDLVFFETYESGASHVGIYMGDSKYIHAGSSGLAINSFRRQDPGYSEYLDTRYIGARRIIQ